MRSTSWAARTAVLRRRAEAKLRVLVTMDLDFADIRAYPPQDYPGLIVLRPRLQVKQHILHLVQRTVPLLDLELLRGRLWIVSESGVRIWEAPSTQDEP